VPFAIQTDGLTAGTKQDGLTVRCRTHAHIVEAYNDEGKLLWQFQTDARVIADPLIHEGRVYVSGRDGWLYCLDAKTGSMHWRFLAAAADRRMVNSNQVESVWPGLGAVLHDGLIWTAAGQNADLDGGLWVWALDKDGAIKKRARVHQPVIEGGSTSKRASREQFDLNVAYYHGAGGGFAAHTIRVHEGTLVLGYRRVNNFGSHPRDAWVYLPVSGEAPAKIIPPGRPDMKRRHSDARFIVVLDELPAKKP
jgi:outer membrane protein assembly factor BamB